MVKIIEKELVKKILSKKGWEKKPNQNVKTYKVFKKLWRKKVNEKLTQCQSEGRRRSYVSDSEEDEFVKEI